MNIFLDQPALPTFWFLLIGVLFIGYLILDGFDLGVGMMMSKVFARNEKERRLLLNTIGPVWDGNEVWLITAGAGIFAAFPFWYASLFSALYIPLTLILVALILRVVAIDYRGKRSDAQWVNTWNTILALSSFFIAFFIGALLAITTTGLPLNERGNVTSVFAWVLNPWTYVGALAIVGFSYVQGLAFVALKTDGEVRHRARKSLVRLLPVAALPAVAWVLWLQFDGPSAGILTYALTVLAVFAVVLAFVSAKGGREGWAFIGTSLFIALGVLAIFLALYPHVLPSTLDTANTLTIENASSSPYTLRIMSWAGCIMLPIVILYQSWTYYQFRQRLSVHNIPEAH